MRLKPRVEPGPPLSREQIQRYSRHLLLGHLGHDGQRRLLNARVAVMGAGGLGAPVLQYLAAAGLGSLTIIDDDVVEPSNLQRQVIHSIADVGRAKVDSAADHIRGLNPEVDVQPLQLRLDERNARELLAGHDVVVDGTDNFPTRYLVSDVCAELGIPVVWASILRFDAQVSVFWSLPVAAGEPQTQSELDTPTTSSQPGPALAGVTLRDLFPVPPPEGSTPSCGEAGVLGAMCGQIGSVMATETVKLITGVGEPLLGRVLVLDTLAQRWSELPVRPRAQSSPAAVCPAAAEPAAPTKTIPSITVIELAERLAARERGADDVVLLDVREATERMIATIPAAVHIPLSEVLADPGAVGRELQRPGSAHTGTPASSSPELLVHCRSGQRSARAVAALSAAGVRAVNVDGGILAWSEHIDPTLPTY